MSLHETTALGLLPAAIPKHNTGPATGYIRSTYSDGTQFVEALPKDGKFRSRGPGPVTLEYAVEDLTIMVPDYGRGDRWTKTTLSNGSSVKHRPIGKEAAAYRPPRLPRFGATAFSVCHLAYHMNQAGFHDDAERLICNFERKFGIGGEGGAA